MRDVICFPLWMLPPPSCSVAFFDQLKKTKSSGNSNASIIPKPRTGRDEVSSWTLRQAMASVRWCQHCANSPAWLMSACDSILPLWNVLCSHLGVLDSHLIFYAASKEKFYWKHVFFVDFYEFSAESLWIHETDFLNEQLQGKDYFHFLFAILMNIPEKYFNDLVKNI